MPDGEKDSDAEAARRPTSRRRARLKHPRTVLRSLILAQRVPDGEQGGSAQDRTSVARARLARSRAELARELLAHRDAGNLHTREVGDGALLVLNIAGDRVSRTRVGWFDVDGIVVGGIFKFTHEGVGDHIGVLNEVAGQAQVHTTVTESRTAAWLWLVDQIYVHEDVRLQHYCAAAAANDLTENVLNRPRGRGRALPPRPGRHRRSPSIRKR